jgi:hypothetical protein
MLIHKDRVQLQERFHSISFPNEWGGVQKSTEHLILQSFHSISFPSEWGGGPAVLFGDREG